mgnify:CR=1 FL=1
MSSMGFEAYNPEAERQRTIQILADAAEKLAHEYEHPHNIYRAIGDMQGAERMVLFREVSKELSKRRTMRGRKAKAEDRELREIRREKGTLV